VSGEQVVDAEVVEELAEVEGELVDRDSSSESHAAGSALAVRAPSREVLMPMDTAQVVEGMRIYQELLKDLLDDSDWQQTPDGKFVKKSGWRKIGRAFNLSVVRISDKVERDANGEPLRAEVVMRAIAPNGQTQDGDGYCSREESRFASERGRAKLENDLRATATTRAKNRAISDLVGMGEVSAEEVSAAPSTSMPLATEQQTGTLGAALNWLLPPAEAAKTWDAIRAQGGGSMLGPIANAVIATVKARKDIEDPAPPAAASAPTAQPAEEKPLPASDLPEPDWDGLARGEGGNV
jgi:hypothetical protein